MTCTCGSNWTDEFCVRHGHRAGQCASCEQLRVRIKELEKERDIHFRDAKKLHKQRAEALAEIDGMVK